MLCNRIILFFMSFFVFYFNEWKVKVERSWLMYGNVDKELLRIKKNENDWFVVNVNLF